MLVEERDKAEVYTPTKRPHIRKGKGFSIKEILMAGLNIHNAKKLGIPIDKRRRSIHMYNVKILKEDYGEVIPLTEIKGIGKIAEKNLIDLGILDVYDLAHVDLDELSRKASYSKKTLKKWYDEAKTLLKG